MRLQLRTAIFLAVVVALALASGCTQTPEEEPAPEALVAPPVIGEAGVLRVGVDLEYPPFAGVDKDREAGIDIDVAGALASRLNLSLETTQVAPSDVATALADGTVDIVMSVPLTEEALTGAAIAGTYIVDGPAFFSRSSDSTEGVTLTTVGRRSIGAQEGSTAYWVLAYELGEEAVTTFPTLRAAFDALEAEEVEIVAGDALVGAYILRDFEGIDFAGQLQQATPLGVAVSPDATELEEIVREKLDELAADGAFETIRATWVGELPELETASPADDSE